MTYTSKIDIWPGAFTAALILSPLVTALLGSSLFFISPIFPLVAIFSVVIGGPLYLIFGGPLLYGWLQAGNPSPLRAAVLGFFINMAICTAGALVAALPFTPFAVEHAVFFLTFGSIFAPIWSAGFAILYNYFSSLNH